MRDVATARGNAMTSYMEADADADKAEAQADAAEATASGSAGAIAARAAATAARMAANAAKTAHDAITDEMTKEQADAKASEAATAAGTANSQYMAAKTQNDAIQTAHMIAQETQRVAGVTTASNAADRAVEAALEAKNDADTAATAAEDARDDAEEALNKAKAARTDTTTAEAEYEKAKAAAEAARTAADNANTAYLAAKAAADGIDDAGTVAAAQTAQGTAETEQRKAETAQMTAETQKTAAMTAEMAAMTASSTHVLELFKAANGAHVTDVASTDVNEKEQHANNVGAAMAHAAAATGGAQATGATNADTFTAGGALTAAAVWPGDTVEDPDTAGDQFVEGKLSINIGVNGGAALPFRLAAVPDDPDTAGTDESAPQTARKIADLGVFDGYEIWEAADDVTTTREGARVIVFTNKQKGTDSKLAVAGGGARSVSDQATPAATELSNVRSTGSTITGVTWTPSGEPPLTGTLNCPANTACNIVLGEDGAVTTITGYRFTGSRGAVTAVTATDATENNNYLMFGLWLDENDDSTVDAFGAFAVGGTGYEDAIAVAVTGTATYMGKAAGAHHKTGEGVNWFDGDASLTANFGDATAPGSIYGSISNIRVAGGEAMSDSIILGQTTLTADSATFGGAAFMGDPTAPGATTHEFDGTWSGSFFGPTTDDTDTADVDESVTAPLAAAGTFGVTKSEGTGDDMVVESFVGAFGAHKQ